MALQLSGDKITATLAQKYMPECTVNIYYGHGAGLTQKNYQHKLDLIKTKKFGPGKHEWKLSTSEKNSMDFIELVGEGCTTAELWDEDECKKGYADNVIVGKGLTSLYYSRGHILSRTWLGAKLPVKAIDDLHKDVCKISLTVDKQWPVDLRFECMRCVDDSKVAYIVALIGKSVGV